MPVAIPLAVAAVGAAGSIYSANKASKDAKKAAQATAVNPQDVYSPFGSIEFNNGQVNATPGQNPFTDLFSQIGTSSLYNAGFANSLPYNGANPALIQAAQEAAQASAPGSNEFNDILTKMRAVAAPEENRQRIGLDNQLFARGMLGSTGGAERFRALTEAQNQADLQRQLAAQGVATENANSRFNRALTTVNQGMSNQQQQFNIGSAANSNIQNIFAQLLQQGGLGISAGGGQAPGAAIYAAQQAGNVPLAISQIATNPAFGNVLSSIFNRQTPGSSPAADAFNRSIAVSNGFNGST